MDLCQFMNHVYQSSHGSTRVIIYQPARRRLSLKNWDMTLKATNLRPVSGLFVRPFGPWNLLGLGPVLNYLADVISNL